MSGEEFLMLKRHKMADPIYSNKTEFNTRQYIRVGTTWEGNYRGVLILSPKSQIENTLSTIVGYSAGVNYSINNCTLSLTAKGGFVNVPMYAYMLPLTTKIDESMTWYSPSTSTGEAFENEGGDIEPYATQITSTGNWSGNTVSFDITPYMNLWNGSESDTLGIVITGVESGSSELHTYFYSSEATTPLTGGKLLTNCKFLGGGDTNTVSTEGVRIKIEKYGAYHTISLQDTAPSGSLYWSIFNASASVGDTFAMFSPDTEQKLSLGTVVCTIQDKVGSDLSAAIVVSGISLGTETIYHTTAEFSATSTIPSGQGIIEFAEPDSKLLFDLSTFAKNDPVYVSYRATTSPNNSKSFTLNFYADETRKNGRARLYLNEPTVSENRIGLNTEIKPQGVQPKIKLSLLV
jgi:hypothetical protein